MCEIFRVYSCLLLDSSLFKTEMDKSNFLTTRRFSKSSISLASNTNFSVDLEKRSFGSMTLPNYNNLNIHNTLERVRKTHNDAVSLRSFDSLYKRWITKAAENDDTIILEMLKENPELVEQKDFASGYTVLHWASKHGNAKLVEILIRKYNADVNQKTHGGYTPLHIARQFGHDKLFDILVDKFDADFTIRDNYGRKPHQYKIVSSNITKRNKTGCRFHMMKIYSFYSQNI